MDTEALPLDPAAVHAATLCLDSHVDIPWPETPDPRGDTPRQVDFPKMRAGGLGAVVFVAFTPQGPRTPEGHAEAAARAEAMLRAIRATAHGEGRRVCATPDAVETAHAARAPAVLLCVENGNAMGRDLSRLALWRGLGACYVTITHNGHNDLSDAAIPRKDLHDPPEVHGGLSALGREALAEMNRLGLMPDVSHIARPAFFQVVEASRAPVVATHSCCAAIRPHPRNLDDAQLDALRDRDGLIQITTVPSFLRAPGPDGAARASVADIADHVDHAVRRMGVERVGIGSDFDGGGGVEGWKDASETPNVTAELLRRGYGPREVAMLWGGNFLRAWRAAEAVAAEGG